MPNRRAHDVIVVGLGGMGSAAVYHLARRGQRVLGLDRFTPAHNRGSSHGGSRLVRRTCWEAPDYVPLAERSYELWRELERSSGEDLLLITGGLLLGSPGCTMLTGAQAVASAWDLDHELLSAAEIRRRFPTLAPGPATVAFFEPTAGVVRPETAVATHLRLAEAAGADLHFGEPVTTWSATPGGGVTVVTDTATYRADRLVICPGAWATPLLGDMGVPFAVQRLVVTWFQPEGGVTLFLPDRHPWWLWDVGSSSSHQLGFPGFVYGFPALDGPDGGVKLSQVSEQPCTAETVDRAVSAAEVEQVAAALRPRLGVPLGPLVQASVCIWTNTPDHHFVLASHPLHPEVVVAAGCSGHAFKFLPVIGEIVADLTLDGKTAHSVALFEPERARASAAGYPAD
jgi:sarcosine oxidase